MALLLGSCPTGCHGLSSASPQPQHALLASVTIHDMMLHQACKCDALTPRPPCSAQSTLRYTVPGHCQAWGPLQAEPRHPLTAFDIRQSRELITCLWRTVVAEG